MKNSYIVFAVLFLSLLALLASCSEKDDPTMQENSKTKMIIGKDGAEMFLISVGEFEMGSENSDPNQDGRKPLHKVYLDAFYVEYDIGNLYPNSGSICVL